MSSQLDQQMYELSTQLSETVNQLKITEANLYAIESEKRRLELTSKEVESCDDNAVLYRSVGRMYLKRPKQQVIHELNQTVSKNTKEGQEYRQKLEQLSKRRDEVSNNIQELVSSVKS